VSLLRAPVAPGQPHDRGRVLSDPACAIADGAPVISDFRVMGDQRELLGPVASVPTARPALKETAASADRRLRKVTAAVNKARRQAGTLARHVGLPPVKVANPNLRGFGAGTGRRHGACIVGTSY
jgi:hypothetical protein